ncbi:MAG: esterase family protein [Nocardioidaceae bacterium]|nr:esterase family protein [Nocardioidaceae bacterium]
MCAAVVSESQLVFTLADRSRSLAAVSLECAQEITGQRRFRRAVGGWQLSLARPSLHRVEYKLLVTTREGASQVGCDPENNERVRTAFGERSVVHMPHYRAPTWLHDRAESGSLERLTHTDRSLGDVPITLWSAPGLTKDTTAPLLVVHDGPEYVDLAGLTTYAEAMVARGTLPTFRMALMQPVLRDEWYSANPDYIAATFDVLDRLADAYSTSADPVVMGASLGGLSALLVALHDRSSFVGVLSQSGSFFQPRLDSQESSYPFFSRVTSAVRAVVDSPSAPRRLVVAMTCGAMEENFANNDAMAACLDRQGHQVTFRSVPDLHNYTAWRDSLDPTMTDLLRHVWGRRG